MEEKWGLVFGGGGAKGAYEIGVWQAMKERGICDRVGGISGASIGALNAVLFASGNLDQAIDAWKHVKLLTVFDTEWSMIDGIEGFALRDGMMNLIRDYVNYDKVYNYPYSIFCSLARILGNNEYECEYAKVNKVSKERLEQVLAASSAMPVVYETVLIDGIPYRDGGLCDNVPIKPLYDEGYRKMILVGLKQNQKKYEEKYPDVEFWSVYPSYSLGELDGTLNFRPSFISFCMKLGYRDGLRMFEAYQSGNVSKEVLDLQAQIDYDRIMAEIRYEKLEKTVNSDFNKLNKILDKYGVDF
ncbi:MAG: patatin-like phospholipase family protein [Lachnospiraceae bacterium]|nr:patatin-like phospholipase family protein [Lachnospiraceae bacterium]